jgi:hypothetical protein
MDNRGYSPRDAPLSRQGRTTNSRRVHPIEDEDEVISLDSFDRNTPTITVS